MRKDWPVEQHRTTAVAVLQYGPCWCRGMPGDAGTFDLFRQRTVEMNLGPLAANVMLVTERVFNGAEAMCRYVYESLDDPKIVVSTGPCPSASQFWDEAPLAWTPVEDVLPVDVRIDVCVSGRPESLLGAILPLLNDQAVVDDGAAAHLQQAHA